MYSQDVKGCLPVWIALGAVQYLATVPTAFEISGRVDIDSYIKLPTNSRNGQFSTLSSSSNLSSLHQLEMEHLAWKSHKKIPPTHGQTFSGVSSEYPSHVHVCRGNLHTTSVHPKFSTETIRFNSSRNKSHLLFSLTARMSSICHRRAQPRELLHERRTHRLNTVESLAFSSVT